MIKTAFKYILVGLFCSIRYGYSQDFHTFYFDSINVKQISYDSLFRYIEYYSEMHFSYFSELIPDQKISVSKEEISLEDVLHEVFLDTEIGFSIYSNHVVLYKIESEPERIKIKGQVISQKEGNGIPYATIEIKGKMKGTISDINGLFELEVAAEFLNDTLLVSSMGYVSRNLPVSHFQNNNYYRLYLEDKIYEINNINIYPEKMEEQIVGNSGTIPKGSMYLDTHGQQTAMFIENSKKIEGVLAGVRYYLSKKGNTEAPLRIHIYSTDTLTGKPLDELLPQMVVVKPSTGKGWMSVNLLEFDIQVPQEGIFVGIEGVFPDDQLEFYDNYEYENQINEEKYDQHILDKISYGQRIGYNFKGKNITWHYSITNTWFKIDKKHFNVMIDARILFREDKSNNRNQMSHEK